MWVSQAHKTKIRFDGPIEFLAFWSVSRYRAMKRTVLFCRTCGSRVSTEPDTVISAHRISARRWVQLLLKKVSWSCEFFFFMGIRKKDWLSSDYDWKSGKYSTWTESTWRELNARIFMKPSTTQEAKTLAIGFVVLIISFILVFLINSKSDILFGDCVSSENT